MEARQFAGSNKDSLSLFHSPLPGTVYLPLPLMYGQMNPCPLVPNPLLPFSAASVLSQHGFSHQMASVLSMPHRGGSEMGKDHHHHGSLLSSYSALLEKSRAHMEKCAAFTEHKPYESGTNSAPSSLVRPIFFSPRPGDDPFARDTASDDVRHLDLSRSSEPSCSPSSTGDEKIVEKMESNDDDLSRGRTEVHSWSIRDHFPPRCPVCGVLVPLTDLGTHFRMEIENLAEFHKNREWLNLAELPSPSELGSPKSPFADSFRLTPRLGDRKNPLSRWEMFLRVRLNRQNRLSAAKGRNRRRSGEMEYADGGMTKHPHLDKLGDDMCCKSSDDRVSATQVDRPPHIGPDEMLHYGSETIIPNSPTHHPDARIALPWPTEQIRVETEGDCTYPPSGGSPNEVSTTSADDKTPPPATPTDEMDKCPLDLKCPEKMIEFLQAKLRHLESTQSKHNHLHCPICRVPHRKPVVSIGCWHVYCEKCWLQILGAKRLCPRCGAITSPADLRRIHL